MSKILIVYGTRKGTTAETVAVIANILKQTHEVDIADSKTLKTYKKQLDNYDFIIIGSSIVSGFWKRKILSFAKKDSLRNKNVAVFVTAGGTLNKVTKYGISKEEAEQEAIQRYIDKYEKKFKFNLYSKAAFGGKLIKNGIVKFNSWNKEDIEKWALSLYC